MMIMNVFKAYDIRGVYPNDLNEKIAYNIGRAIVESTGVKTIIIGKDMRKSGKGLFDAIVNGITIQGADVVDIGMCTTPMIGFSVCKYNFDFGIMITASHNPKEYNGFKLIGKKGIQLSSDNGIGKIEKIAGKNKFIPAERKGKITTKNILDDYVSHIMNFAEGIRKMKVVVDYGNGVGAISAKPVFEKLPLEIIPLFENPDDEFPNHPANPHDIKNFDALIYKIKKTCADIGIFFDGDADRANIVDENGTIVFPDIMLCVLAKEQLKKYPKEKVYYDLRSTKVLKKVIEKAGGLPILTRVGNPFYKEKLINEGGCLGGELSGHVMYRQNYCIDDGLFSSLQFLKEVSKSGRKVSELVAEYKTTFKTPEINLKVKDADETMKKIEEAFSDGKISYLDGMTVEYSNYWFNIRKSNTEPLIRLNIEADTKEIMEKTKEKLLEIINSA
ncbi:MAG: phosphomannomutase/phosphoglucomutase [Candidatus Nanohalarchaeota archaeon]|nr:MAG: phosphomannomutase/phosphoglucomutase [Candidatus Nanohaloarchaeota archaeon]